jgi:hypothetical protein
MVFQSRSEQLAELIRFLKTDDSATKLQEMFYDQAEHPLETGQ